MPGERDCFASFEKDWIYHRARRKVMGRVYNVVDSDGHILEPPTLWDDYIAAAFRDRAPKLVVDKDGKQRLLIEEQILGSRQGMGGIGGVGARRAWSRPRR